MKREQLENKVAELYNNLDLSEKLGRAVNKAILSGDIDLDSIPENDSMYARTILAVVFSDTSDDYRPDSHDDDFELFNNLKQII